MVKRTWRLFFSQLNTKEILDRTLLKENSRKRNGASGIDPEKYQKNELMNVRKNLIPTFDEAINDKPYNGADNDGTNK
jgi:hypothetical protein